MRARQSGMGPALPLEGRLDVAMTTFTSTARIQGQFADAWRDLVRGYRSWEFWGAMAWNDIRQRYRRSILGPFWLTISMGILVGTLGVLFADLFGRSIPDFLPHIALGFILWSLISSLVIDGCDIFVKSRNIILEINAPTSIHNYRLVWRDLIIFAHNIWIFVAVALILNIWPGPVALLAIGGLALICFNGFWLSLLLGMICARYRDVKPIVGSAMQIAFFLTPIIWKVDQLSKRAELVEFNPFYHFIELVRQPLLGHAPAVISWIVVLGITAVLAVVSFCAFARFRSRIPYWI